jgi:hypothetical protein
MLQAGQHDGERADGDRDPLLPLPLQQDHRQPLRGSPGHPEPPTVYIHSFKKIKINAKRAKI